MADNTPSNAPQKPGLFSGAIKVWKFTLGFIAFSIAFWLAEFAYQFYFASPGDFKASVIRSLALASATFISLSLLSSSIFKFWPKYARYWTVRRALGVAGFLFGALHVMAAVNFVFNGDFLAPYAYSLNPIVNPIIFGGIAYALLFIITLTSTDWAVARMGIWWKRVHRLVYFAFWGMIFHFLLTNPPALMNIAGYLLLGVTGLALAGQLYWYIYFVLGKKTTTKGAIVGVAVIAMFLITAYLAWFAGK